MISFNPSDSPLSSLDGILLDKCITVKSAAEVTGYRVQYLRRLLRAGILEGIKIGSAQFKFQVALEAAKETKTINQIAGEGDNLSLLLTA